MIRHFRGGKLGWVILAAFVVLWDNLARETLSDAFWRGLLGRRSRFFVIALWAIVTSHLFLRTPLPLRLIRLR